MPTESRSTVSYTPLSEADDIVRRMQALQIQAPIEIVAIGVSTGGPQALIEVIPYLPANLAVPVVIVQHMPQTFTGALAASLNDKSVLTVIEGHNGQTLEAGMVYIAPGGKQMKIVQQSQRQAPNLLMTDDPPENHCKPSVDYLFRSVAHLYAHRALGVIMTGMGADGVQGLRLMKQQGAKILAQDAASCVVFGMPMEAIKAGVVDAVVPLGQLAAAIIQHVGRR
jgi:two-component system, chemotaxis family, protein-glutamate methylesterase/glutaminase